MSRDEKLNAILARCREIIVLGEKRTQGEWLHRQGEYCSHWISTQSQLCNIAEVPTNSAYCAAHPSENAAFIAACAGPAEAMARSTIAAIEGLKSQPERHWLISERFIATGIIAAWEGLLKTGETIT